MGFVYLPFHLPENASEVIGLWLRWKALTKMQEIAGSTGQEVYPVGPIFLLLADILTLIDVLSNPGKLVALYQERVSPQDAQHRSTTQLG